MIVVSNLIGGLGNQMFQIATGYACAKTRGFNFFAHDKKWGALQGNHPDVYKNNLFSKIQFIENAPECEFSHFQTKYKEIPHFDDKNFILYGYFPTEKYFKNYKNEINALFEFPNTVKRKIETALSNITNPTIAVHIRRGDYVSIKNHPAFDIMRKDYYEKAIGIMEDFYKKEINLILVTDDIEEVKKEFDVSQFTFFNYSEIEDLYLLTQCDSTIMSNSTFSWWGTWLGNHDKVICPSEWYRPKSRPEDCLKDIYCEGWIKI